MDDVSDEMTVKIMFGDDYSGNDDEHIYMDGYEYRYCIRNEQLFEY